MRFHAQETRRARQDSNLLALFLIPLALVALAVPLAWLPLPLAILLLTAVVCGTLALIDPAWAVCWAVLSVPVQEVIHLPAGLTVTQVALLLAAGAWALRVLAAPTRPVRGGPLGVPLACVLFALALSTAFTPYSPAEGIKETLRWLWVVLTYLIVVNCATNQRRMVIILAALMIAPSAEALYGLWQFVTASGPPSFQVAGGRFVRAYGTIGQPNSFAGYMNMAWPLAFALGASIFADLWQFLRKRETRDARRETDIQLAVSSQQSTVSSRQSPIAHRPSPIVSLKIAGAIAAVVLLAALGASFSRGGWVGALGGALALGAVWMSKRTDGGNRAAYRGRILITLCLAVVAVLLVALLNNAGLLPASVANRIDSIFNNIRLFDVRTVDVTPDNFAVVERMAHIQAAWGMFTSYPLLGVGPGNFTPAYPDFSIPPWLISQGHAHNYYLHSAAEGGVVGALAYLALLVAVVRLCIRAVGRASRPLDRLVAAGGCGMMGAVVVHNLFENLHVLNLPIQIGAVWGLLVVIQSEPESSRTYEMR